MINALINVSLGWLALSLILMLLFMRSSRKNFNRPPEIWHKEEWYDTILLCIIIPFGIMGLWSDNQISEKIKVAVKTSFVKIKMLFVKFGKFLMKERLF